MSNDLFATKTCTSCFQAKLYSAFSIDRSKRNGRRSKCLDCENSIYDPIARKRKKLDEPERFKKTSARHYKKHKVKYDLAAKHSLTTAKGRATQLTTSARSRSKEYDYSFDLTREFVQRKIEAGKCEKSGLNLDLMPHPTQLRNGFAPSLDRIDNSFGYTQDNVQIVCNMYNSGKGEHDELDFIAMCVAVAERYADNPAVIARLGELRNAGL